MPSFLLPRSVMSNAARALNRRFMLLDGARSCLSFYEPIVGRARRFSRNPSHENRSPPHERASPFTGEEARAQRPASLLLFVRSISDVNAYRDCRNSPKEKARD